MPSLSRRALLRGAAVSALAVPLGTVALTACSSEPSPEDVLAQRLVPLATAAVAAAATARQLKATEPGRAAALDEIATIRETHAKALREEIARLHPSSAQLLTTPSATVASIPQSPSTGTATPGAPAPAPTTTGLDELRTSFTADARAARHVATTASGFQAGLTASVAASITSLQGLLS